MDFKNVPPLNFDNQKIVPVPVLDTTNNLVRQVIEQRREKENQERQQMEEDKAIKLKLLENSEEIKINTSILPEIVGLVRKNNEINEEMIGLLNEINNVMKAQTKQEAEDVVGEVVRKATTLKDGIDTAVAFANYGKMLIKLLFLTE